MKNRTWLRPLGWLAFNLVALAYVFGWWSPGWWMRYSLFGLLVVGATIAVVKLFKPHASPWMVRHRRWLLALYVVVWVVFAALGVRRLLADDNARASAEAARVVRERALEARAKACLRKDAIACPPGCWPMPNLCAVEPTDCDTCTRTKCCTHDLAACITDHCAAEPDCNTCTRAKCCTHGLAACITDHCASECAGPGRAGANGGDQ